ncbi:MAG: bacteriocin immunity protein [Liquorilactobacillus nagelii]|jgi:hypothetical protein|uniref:bacteriocin immunity protein n=1 Tax=Liquorilactobacillus nagelii TaxID=82688 RepID=UPI002430C88F|nr:bacteriocin immunity protein [Liquorilactobacillus nagelii]MCI1633598.1 bacteriocin immunity protein [Liquorilactobacillus nagelii]
MFAKKITEQEILSKFYDFVLEPTLSERERKIGLMAKNDLERGRYNVAVVNQSIVSLQQEAIKNGLTPRAAEFYHMLESTANEITPWGTNRGAVQVINSYLDD